MASDDRELRFSKKPAQVSDAEQRRIYIEVLGLSEPEANFYMALEQGLIEGDTVALGGEDLLPVSMPGEISPAIRREGETPSKPVLQGRNTRKAIAQRK